MIQENMFWGDTPTGKKKEDINDGVEDYIRRYYTVDNQIEMTSMKGDMMVILKDIRKEINECTNAKLKMDFYPKAYEIYGITYVHKGVVLPATCLETIKKSWAQDFSLSNTKLQHCFWDHMRQEQTLWAEIFSQDVMDSCNLVYDPSYTKFTTRNQKKTRGPKFNDGALENVKFYMKTVRDSFRKVNLNIRSFIVKSREKKGKVGADLETQLKEFCIFNPVLTKSKDLIANSRAIFEIKKKDRNM